MPAKNAENSKVPNMSVIQNARNLTNMISLVCGSGESGRPFGKEGVNGEFNACLWRAAVRPLGV